MFWLIPWRFTDCQNLPKGLSVPEHKCRSEPLFGIFSSVFRGKDTICVFGNYAQDSLSFLYTVFLSQISQCIWNIFQRCLSYLHYNYQESCFVCSSAIVRIHFTGMWERNMRHIEVRISTLLVIFLWKMLMPKTNWEISQ